MAVLFQCMTKFTTNKKKKKKKRPWCWEGLGAGGEGDDRGWDGWMASPTQWTWVWVNSGSCWWTGRPGVLWFMGSQRVRHDWATELNWTIVSGGLIRKSITSFFPQSFNICALIHIIIINNHILHVFNIHTLFYKSALVCCLTTDDMILCC